MVVCAGFGLTVSEAKTDIMSESTAIFSVEAAGCFNNCVSFSVYVSFFSLFLWR